MKFWRKKPPDGAEVSDEFARGMRAMEAWYQGFVVWAYAYISLLEMRLQQRDEECCGECKNRNNEGSDADNQKDG